MTDIQTIHAEMHLERFIMVHRTFDGFPVNLRMPKEILSMHAAEYNLEPDDPFVLDLVLLQDLYPHTVEDKHPLHWSDTIEEAVVAMEERLEWVRNEHGSPAAPNRMLAHAVENNVATEGLVVAQSLMIQNINHEVIEPVQFFRDRIRNSKREQKKDKPLSHSQLLHRQMRQIQARELTSEMKDTIK